MIHSSTSLFHLSENSSQSNLVEVMQLTRRTAVISPLCYMHIYNVEDYKLKDHGFDSRRGHYIFQLT
jgi:hypothetical protein